MGGREPQSLLLICCSSLTSLNRSMELAIRGSWEPESHISWTFTHCTELKVESMFGDAMLTHPLTRPIAKTQVRCSWEELAAGGVVMADLDLRYAEGVTAEGIQIWVELCAWVRVLARGGAARRRCGGWMMITCW